MGRSIIRLVGTVAVTSAFVVAAVAATVAAPAGAAPPMVVVVGDSITRGAKAQIDAVFGTLEGWNVFSDGVGGASVASRRQDIRDYVNFFDPDVLVIELGTNDMGGVELNPAGQAPPTGNQQLVRYANAVAQMVATLDQVANVPCVVWVNVNDWTNWDPYPDHNSGRYNLRGWAPFYNADLRDEDLQRSRVHVVDYVARIEAQRLRAGDQNFLPWLAHHYDPNLLIHPYTTQGKQTVAKIMAQGTAAACGI